MIRSLARGGLCACGLVLLSSFVLYATPGFWEAATQADFLRGEVEHLSIDEHGRLMLGPDVQRVSDPSVPFVWALLPAADGGYLLGSGMTEKCFASTKPVPRRRTSTAPKWKSTRSRRRQTAARTWARLRTAASTKSIRTGRPRPFSIPKTNTFGR